MFRYGDHYLAGSLVHVQVLDHQPSWQDNVTRDLMMPSLLSYYFIDLRKLSSPFCVIQELSQIKPIIIKGIGLDKIRNTLYATCLSVPTLH